MNVQRLTDRMIADDGMTEAELTEAVKQRKQSATEILYRRYVAHLSSVCYRYVANEEDVKDVLQESFVRIFSSMERFSYRGEGSLKAWMTKIVVSRALTFLRNNKRLLTTDGNATEMDIGEEAPPDTGLLSDDELHALIRTLPDGYRTVLNLFVFEDKSHKEIAEILGIRESSSASQYFHAKNLLARKIKDYLSKRR